MADVMILPSVPQAPLRALCEDDRFRELDKREAYFRKTQDNAKRYNWDGYIDGDTPIKPGWSVPHQLRKPSVRYDMANLIVSRLSSFVFGQDRFPEVRIEDDPDAEDYARELANVARLATKMAEARDLGGATGTACLSFGFRKGKPRVHVHNPKHVLVMAWEDYDERRPASVLKAYASPRQYYDVEQKRIRTKNYWTVYHWTSAIEVVWRNIPEEVANLPTWSAWSERILNVHDYGFCPFYWIQNRSCSEEADGEGDYEGLEGTFDQINRLLSATTKGTIANVDPTLVIKEDPSANTGQVFKGSENAIFSRNGAEYLELKGTAVQTAERQLERLRQYVLDVAGVVLADAEKLAGAAQSAKALEILYQPMIANCDKLREKYGEHGIKAILLDMLRVARKMESAPPELDPATGEMVQRKVMLAPRLEREERKPTKPGEDPSAEPPKPSVVERTPGTSENISLNWRPYFSATWKDIVDATTGMKNANGGKPTVSQRTSVQAIAPLVGIEDIDAEMARIEEETAAEQEHAMDMFAKQAETESKFAPDKGGGFGDE